MAIANILSDEREEYILDETSLQCVLFHFTFTLKAFGGHTYPGSPHKMLLKSLFNNEYTNTGSLVHRPSVSNSVGM